MNILRRFIPEEKSARPSSVTASSSSPSPSPGAPSSSMHRSSSFDLLGPIFGIIACLIPAYLVYKVDALHKYKGISLVLIVFAGILLIISPVIAMM